MNVNVSLRSVVKAVVACVRCQDLQLRDKYKMRDLWKKADAGSWGETYSTSIPSHGAVLLRLTRSQP